MALSCLLAEGSDVNARSVLVGERSRSRGSRSRAGRTGEREDERECNLGREEERLGGFIAGLGYAMFVSSRLRGWLVTWPRLLWSCMFDAGGANSAWIRRHCYEDAACCADRLLPTEDVPPTATLQSIYRYSLLFIEARARWDAPDRNLYES